MGNSFRHPGNDERTSVAELLSVVLHHSIPALHFELDSVEGNLQEMDGAVVGVDHQLPIGPLGIFVSADEEFECRYRMGRSCR